MISKSDIIFALVRYQHDIYMHCCYFAASLVMKSIFITSYYFCKKKTANSNFEKIYLSVDQVHVTSGSNGTIKVDITKFQHR